MRFWTLTNILDHYVFSKKSKKIWVYRKFNSLSITAKQIFCFCRLLFKKCYNKKYCYLGFPSPYFEQDENSSLAPELFVIRALNSTKINHQILRTFHGHRMFSGAWIIDSKLEKKSSSTKLLSKSLLFANTGLSRRFV